MKQDALLRAILWRNTHCFSVTKSCLTLCNSMGCSMPACVSFTISQSLPKLMCIELIMPSNCLILYHLLLLLPSIFHSIRVFSNESAACVTWPKYWSFSFIISPSNKYSELISFRINWFDLAVERTAKSLPQHHSSKALVLLHSAFFMFQLSYPYMSTGKTIALTIQTFVHKVMSLLFNTLYRFLLAFLPRSKHPLILWLQAPSAVILELKKIKSVSVSTFTPSVCHEVIGLDVVTAETHIEWT